MGTVRHEIHTVSLGFSRADRGAPDTARAAVLYGHNVPISGQADSRESVPYKEKRTLPGAPADVSEVGCVAALVPCGTISALGFGNINPLPFRLGQGFFLYRLFDTAAQDFARVFVRQSPTPPFQNGVLL